jgi:hypothetical protein
MDPELEAAARQVRHEARLVAEDLEADVIATELTGRTLADACRELHAAARLVALTLPGVAFSGAIVHVGIDMVTVADDHGNEFDVLLPAIGSIKAVGDARVRPRELASDPKRLRGRLAHAAAIGQHVEVGGPALPAVSGSAAAAAEDHLVLDAADGRLLIPYPAIAWIVRRSQGASTLRASMTW